MARQTSRVWGVEEALGCQDMDVNKFRLETKHLKDFADSWLCSGYYSCISIRVLKISKKKMGGGGGIKQGKAPE